jgi:hypothetical protein
MIIVQGRPQTKVQDPIQKITKAKRAGSVAQVLECLPSKYKALNSIPQYHQKIKELENK